MTERYLDVKFEETGEAILMLDGPLTRALSTSINNKLIAQVPDAILEAPRDLVH
jgi:hypothetical protein